MRPYRKSWFIMRLPWWALSLAAFAGCGTVDLSLSQPSQLRSRAMLAVRTLTVVAPTSGTDVSPAEVTYQGAPMVVSTPNAIFIHGAGPAKIRFVYTLKNDSAPLFRAAFGGLLREEPSSEIDARLLSDFKFGILGKANGALIYMSVSVVLTSGTRILLNETCVASAAKTYASTLTTELLMLPPSEKLLDDLFQTAVESIGICVAKHILKQFPNYD